MQRTEKAPPFLASKWLHLDFLLDTDEIKVLFDTPFHLFSTLGVQPKGKNSITKEAFFAAWQRYIEELKAQKLVVDSDFRFYFTAVLTRDVESVLALDVAGDKEIIIPYRPLVQMQLHRFAYSQADHKFHSQAFGTHSISWGVRLSYPQLFQFPETRKIEECLDPERFVNAELFLFFRRALRNLSMATPFVVHGERTNVPIRIGKNVLPWIDQHAELSARGIKVLKL